MRILIVRTSSLGDIVHALPALRLLRRHLPDAHIGWVVEEVFAPLLARDPDLDEVLGVRFRPWRRGFATARTWGDLRSRLGRVRGFDADVVLDLMGNHKAGLLAAASGCERRIGLARSLRREGSSAIWLSEWVDDVRGVHAVDRAIAVAAALGVPNRFEGFGPEKIRAAAGDAPPAADPGYIVVHPGAARADKRYPPGRWGHVAAALARATGREILISVGHGEEALAAALEIASGGRARRAQAFDLPRLVRLLGEAAMVLGGDTGPLHLAHALGVPALFLHGPTDTRTHGPYGAPERALRSAGDTRPGPPDGSGRPSGADPAAIEIDEDVVVARALALLTETAGGGAPSPPEGGSAPG